jgi:DNA polymerase-3 subunit epsilon
MPGFAVIDTETTGFGRQDQVIEVGVVLLDSALATEAVWDTLIDPGRDVGPTHVHHISSDDVVGAPVFAQVAGPLTEQLGGRIVVGHNVNFDRRMLNQEFERLGAGSPLKPEFSLDTLTLCRDLELSPTRCYTLDFLCQTHGIRRALAHSALNDAQATAELLTLAQQRQPAAVTTAAAARQAAAASAQWPVFSSQPVSLKSRSSVG